MHCTIVRKICISNLVMVMNRLFVLKGMLKVLIKMAGCHHHHHHVQEGLGLIPVPCILKMKLVPPSLPRASYVSSSFWFILQCLFRYPVCVHPLYVSQPLFLVLFYFLYYILCSYFFPNTLVFFLSLVLLFQEGVSKISSVLLLNVVPLYSSVPRLHLAGCKIIKSFDKF